MLTFKCGTQTLRCGQQKHLTFKNYILDEGGALRLFLREICLGRATQILRVCPVGEVSNLPYVVTFFQFLLEVKCLQSILKLL